MKLKCYLIYTYVLLFYLESKGRNRKEIRNRDEMEMMKEMGRIGITGHGVRNILECGG